jgi:hypothetical protein
MPRRPGRQKFHPYLIFDEIAFVIVVVLLEWVVVVCDMRIYMLFEGRHGWPKRLLTFWHECQEKRLNRIQEILQNSNPASNEYLEASVELRTFPVDEDGDYKVIYPSQ